MKPINKILNKLIRILTNLKSVENNTDTNGHIHKPLFSKEFSELSQYEIGKWTYGKPEILDWNDGTKLVIGNFCSIALDVKIFLGGEHYYEYVSSYPFHKLFLKEPQNAHKDQKTKGDVIIGNDVWIGRGAYIMSGVKINNGAVIGAAAVVTKDVPPYAIVAGNPAKIIKYRFDANTIRRLEDLAWWNWDDEKIEKNISILMNRPEYFFETEDRIKTEDK
jgi:virginiamycin A acetyltransferase